MFRNQHHGNGHDSTNTSRDKFLRWLETEEVSDSDQTTSEEINHGETRCASTISDDEITRILFEELKEGHDGQRERVVTDRGSISDRGRKISSSISIDTDWSGLYESLGNPSTPENVDGGDFADLLEGAPGVVHSYDDIFEPVDTFEEEFENGLQKYARSLYSRFVSGQHRYLSIVVVPDGRLGVKDCIREIMCMVERHPPKHWWVVASHKNHIHVSHICAYNNDSCRCLWIRRSTSISAFRRRGLRRITRAHQLQPSDYASILRYLSSGSRFIEGVGGYSEDERLCNRYKHLSAST